MLFKVYNYFYNLSYKRRVFQKSNYLKKPSNLQINHFIRYYRMTWGYIYYKIIYTFLYITVAQQLLNLERYNLFEHEKRILPLFMPTRFYGQTKWYSSYRYHAAFFNRKNIGALKIRATYNNFFITFLRGTGQSEVAMYISAGVIEHGLTRKRRTDYIAKLTSGLLAYKIKKRYRRVRKLYIFINGPVCKRALHCLLMFRRQKFRILNIYFTRNVAHNGIRLRKARRKKKLN